MTTERIVFKIDCMPISTNQIWRTNYRTKRRYLNPKYKVFRQIAALRVGGTRMPSDWPYAFVRLIVHPKRRIGDADNYSKCCLDSLTYAGFWVDDKVVSDCRSGFGAPDKNGSVEIILERSETKFEDH